MKLNHNLLTAAALALAYTVLRGFSGPLGGQFLIAFAVALVLVFLGSIAVSVAALAMNVARIRADLAQWMRDPKAADPEDSYLARLARHHITK